MSSILFYSDVLIDRSVLAATMPDAWAQVLTLHNGGTVDGWRNAYLRVLDDWESYWADLDLNEGNSLIQWREGRWRVIRALFRLSGQPDPRPEEMTLYLDRLPREVGRHCAGWRSDAMDVLHTLASQKHRLGLLTPYLPACIVWGMLDSAGLTEMIQAVLGPDELNQVGLDGVDAHKLASLSGVELGRWMLIGPVNLPGVRAIPPPDELSILPDLLLTER